MSGRPMFGTTDATLSQMRKREEAERKARAYRQRVRDAMWASWERENGVGQTMRENEDGTHTLTRGRCAFPFSSNFKGGIR